MQIGGGKMTDTTFQVLNKWQSRADTSQQKGSSLSTLVRVRFRDGEWQKNQKDETIQIEFLNYVDNRKYKCFWTSRLYKSFIFRT